MNYNVSIYKSKISVITKSSNNELVIDNKKISFSENAFIYPGFADSHCHLFGLGLMQTRVQLTDCKSEKECSQKVFEASLKLNSKNDWIIGFGWNQEDWDVKINPTKKSISNIENPVLLYRIDTHAAWVNDRALQLSEINNNLNIVGGEILVDENKSPNGILIDNAIKIIENLLIPLTKSQKLNILKNSINECISFGLTEVHDMNVDFDTCKLMLEISSNNEMLIRNNVFLKYDDSNIEYFVDPIFTKNNLDIVGFKFFADGALGSRGANLFDKYDDENTYGLDLLSTYDLIEMASKPLSKNFAIATHAIGDKANRTVLNAYSILRNKFPNSILRVEHSQILDINDFYKFKKYNLIPSVQPIHFCTDVKMAEKRLGLKRLEGAYLWNSFLNDGVKLLGGSDFPIEMHDPLTGIRAFCGYDDSAWHSKEIIDLDSAIKAYTIWSQYGLPKLNNRGELKVGNDADLVVLSGNPLDIDTKVLMTIVGGKIVYNIES